MFRLLILFKFSLEMRGTVTRGFHTVSVRRKLNLCYSDIYATFPKCWDTITPCHTSKILTLDILNKLRCPAHF